MSYDPRAVKIKKEYKTFATLAVRESERRSYYKSYTKVEEAAMRTRSSRNKGDRADS